MFQIFEAVRTFLKNKLIKTTPTQLYNQGSEDVKQLKNVNHNNAIIKKWSTTVVCKFLKDKMKFFIVFFC